MTVLERLQAAIIERGISQAELARRLGEQPMWVNRRLSGDTDLKVDELPRFAEVLGMSPCDFFEDRPKGVLQAGTARAVARVPSAVFESSEEERMHIDYIRDAMGLNANEAAAVVNLVETLKGRHDDREPLDAQR